MSGFGSVFGVESDETTLAADSPWRDQIFRQPFDAGFQPRQRFDLILMLDVLEHLPDPAAALEHARSLLTPGGRILITVPALNALDHSRRRQPSLHSLRSTVISDTGKDRGC